MVSEATPGNKGRNDRESQAGNKRIEAAPPVKTRGDNFNDISRELLETVDAYAY